MSGTRRTPIARRAALQITARAIALFEQLERVRRQRRGSTCVVRDNPSGYCTAECQACESWFDLMDALHSELGLRPWFWPCLPQNPYPPGTPASRDWRPGGNQLKLWQALDQARRAARRRPQLVTETA
jgi:hypothetical protein